MHWAADLGVSIGHDLASMALAAVCYGVIQRLPLGAFHRSCLIGLVFGIAAILMMTAPLHLAEGVVADGSFVSVGLAGAFGGIPASILSVLMAGAFRASLDDPGAAIAIASIVFAGVSGPVWAHMHMRRSKLSGPSLCMFGAVLSVHLASIALGPAADALSAMSTTWITAFPLYVGASVTFGLLMSRERTLIDREDELKRLTYTDHLTGLPNRRCFIEHVETALRTETNGGYGFAILMIDIDYFKNVNDTYGHDAGDCALIAVADVLKQDVSRYDLSARYGGEEFAVFLIYSTPNQAMDKAEKLRKRIESLKINNKRTPFGVTISVGMSTSYGRDMNARTIISKADEALYKAKQRGRNRVEADTETAGRAPNQEPLVSLVA